MGCLKVEKSGIVKFFSQAAKTYSYETLEGEITLKAKGFSLLEKLLKDNNKEKLLEMNLVEMFSSVNTSNVKNSVPVKIFQKQIKVNPLHMVPALIPKEKSYKVLNFIGPRRQIDIGSWLNFKFEKVKVFRNFIQIDPLQTRGQECDPDQEFEKYNCKGKVTLQKVSCDTAETDVRDQDYVVKSIPQLKGVLPALPFGFDVKSVKENVKFYCLLD